MIDKVLEEFCEKHLPPAQYGALTLAYIGDCVYELYVRSRLISEKDRKVNELHKTATKYVCAGAQAAFFHRIEGLLTEDEMLAFKRGRNTKSQVPKNADVKDYRTATGVEALFGYLYLNGETDRMKELLIHIFD